jgi:hypothetical protein
MELTITEQHHLLHDLHDIVHCVLVLLLYVLHLVKIVHANYINRTPSYNHNQIFGLV